MLRESERDSGAIRLNDGIEMPHLGFDVFQIEDEGLCERCTSTALRAGYRMIDTAACYGNERAVGAAIDGSGVSREDVFLVSKGWA